MMPPFRGVVVVFAGTFAVGVVTMPVSEFMWPMSFALGLSLTALGAVPGFILLYVDRPK